MHAGEGVCHSVCVPATGSGRASERSLLFQCAVATSSYAPKSWLQMAVPFVDNSLLSTDVFVALLPELVRVRLT